MIDSLFFRPVHILKEFFNIRMQYYDRRKSMLIKRLTEDWERLDNKVTSYCHVDLLPNLTISPLDAIRGKRNSRINNSYQ